MKKGPAPTGDGSPGSHVETNPSLAPLPRGDASDAAIEATVYALLAARAPTSTVCPSEVARALAPGDGDSWRGLMPAVRKLAATLARAGRLRVTRRGVPVDAESPGGPIRLGRP